MGMRVLVLDDTVVLWRAISRVQAGIPGVEVAGATANETLLPVRMGALGRELTTLGIEAPEVKNIEVLEAMGHQDFPHDPIVLGALNSRSWPLTIHGVVQGAFSFLTRPEGCVGFQNLTLQPLQLIPLMRIFELKMGIRRIPPIPSCGQSPGVIVLLPRLALGVPERAAREFQRTGSLPASIGACSGGTAGFIGLSPAPADGFGAPRCVVQHMPVPFEQSWPKSLAGKSHTPLKKLKTGKPHTRIAHKFAQLAAK